MDNLHMYSYNLPIDEFDVSNFEYTVPNDNGGFYYNNYDDWTMQPMNSIVIPYNDVGKNYPLNYSSYTDTSVPTFWNDDFTGIYQDNLESKDIVYEKTNNYENFRLQPSHIQDHYNYTIIQPAYTDLNMNFDCLLTSNNTVDRGIFYDNICMSAGPTCFNNVDSFALNVSSGAYDWNKNYYNNNELAAKNTSTKKKLKSDLATFFSTFDPYNDDILTEPISRTKNKVFVNYCTEQGTKNNAIPAYENSRKRRKTIPDLKRKRLANSATTSKASKRRKL